MSVFYTVLLEASEKHHFRDQAKFFLRVGNELYIFTKLKFVFVAYQANGNSDQSLRNATAFEKV